MARSASCRSACCRPRRRKSIRKRKPLFAGYRNVPWLARTHAVTVVPSASALVTLRRLPPGSPSRDKLIGFGDPYFNAQEAAEAEAEQRAPVQVAVRGSSDAPR